MNRLAATLVVVVTLIVLLVFERTTESSAALLAAQAAPPDAVAADPARYSVLYENDVALIIRVKFPAGAKSVMHSHPAGCAIFYKDATLKMTSPTGMVRTHEYRAGDVSCGDAYSHLPENVGRDTEFVQFHLKNRQTFDHLQTGRASSILLESRRRIQSTRTLRTTSSSSRMMWCGWPASRFPEASKPRCTRISPTASWRSATWKPESRRGTHRAAMPWLTKA